MNNFRVISLALCSAAMIAVPAHAQQIEEIVVTAQKRSENLQSVPLSVSAVTSNQAQAQGIRTSEDLSSSVPGLVAEKQGGATLFFLRGVGTTGGQAGQENAVATFVDGVYQPSMLGSLFSLNNIERIEVLKGPQGTLYGRNATGGAVNVITRTPSHDTSVNAEIGYGNRETIEANLYATTGIAEGVAADVAGYYYRMGEGFGRNVTLGGDVNIRKDLAVRSKLLIEPSDDTTITLAGDYSKTWGDAGLVYRAGPTSSTFLTGQQGFPFGFWDTNANVKPEVNVKNYGGSLRAEHELGFGRIISTTAIRRLRGYQQSDDDLSALPTFEYDSLEKDKQFTQELQLSSDESSAVKWTVGAFYLSAVANQTPLHLYGAVLGTDGQSIFAKQKTKSIAIYGQTTFEIFEDTNLTLGGRYTRDRRRLNASVVGHSPTAGDYFVVAPFQRKATFKKPTWRIALDHKLNDDVMLFGSYSRGFKSGIFNLTAPTDPAVRPETLDAFELGMKSQLFDRRLRINPSIYYYKYSEIQLTKIVGAAQSLLNAAKAEIYGADLEVEAAVSSQFTVRGGVSWVHGRYQKFEGAPSSTPNLTPPFGNAVGITDASGNRMVRTPDWTANISADYTAPVAGGEMTLSGSYAYNDGFFWEPDNRVKQKAYSMVNGQITWTPESESFRLRAFARNLLNTKHFTQVSEIFLGDLAVAAPGRTYGVSVGVNF